MTLNFPYFVSMVSSLIGDQLEERESHELARWKYLVISRPCYGELMVGDEKFSNGNRDSASIA